MSNLSRSLKKQVGAVLATSLIMLLLLTLIGVSAMQTTSLEEKMAGNMRDRNVAFQAAESALRAGETFLTQATLPIFTNSGTDGLYSEAATAIDLNGSWTGLNKASYPTNTLSGVTAVPEYVIQKLGNVDSGGSLDAMVINSSEMYRISARGVGGTSTAVVVVQSIYKR